ncbi:hypothetical protein An08g00250 [Aspergillus niger]|uniref:Uncharacterized protein n=2 Tax=Aspergillus niger TaxID=5061 RepID=A2QPU7_ASPNC|nr:hypothetical protein An08g00250 [Aspergillus niger]CAK45177.1 hypothetical protein An08g00250 [Aspergillus niger]
MAPKSDTFDPILLRNETQSIHGTEIPSVAGFVQAPAVPRRITRSYRTTTTDPGSRSFRPGSQPYQFYPTVEPESDTFPIARKTVTPRAQY